MSRVLRNEGKTQKGIFLVLEQDLVAFQNK